MKSAVLFVLCAACGSVASSTKTGEPTVVSLLPDHGSIIGGTMVTLTGTGFGQAGELGSGTVVLVGDRAATAVTVVNDTSLTFVAPAGAEEGATVDVTVANGNGFGALPHSFRYAFRPLLLSISPDSGKGAGGTAVTLSGRGFQVDDAGAPTVTIAGSPATNVVVVDDKTITATSAAAATGTVGFALLDTTIANANGASTLAKSFRVTAPGLIALTMPNRCCGNSNVTFIDPSGTSVPLPPAGSHLHACAADQSGHIFVVEGPRTTRQLATLDPASGTVTVIGPLNDSGAVNHNMASLVFVGTTLYGLDSANDIGGNGSPSHKLVTIDTTTGIVTVVGAAAVTGTSNNSIALKDANTLYIADAITGTLDTIPISTLTRTAGVAMTGGASATAHGMVNTGSALYIAGGFSDAIYVVTPTTNVLTPFATTSAPIVGLCQTPSTF